MSSARRDKSFCPELIFLFGLTTVLGLLAFLDLTDDLGLTAIVF
jgi:hypothetical protein